MAVFRLGQVGVVEVSLEPAPERGHHPDEPCFGDDVRALVVIGLLLPILGGHFFNVTRRVFVSTDHVGERLVRECKVYVVVDRAGR